MATIYGDAVPPTGIPDRCARAGRRAALAKAVSLVRAQALVRDQWMARVSKADRLGRGADPDGRDAQLLGAFLVEVGAGALDGALPGGFLGACRQSAPTHDAAATSAGVWLGDAGPAAAQAASARARGPRPG